MQNSKVFLVDVRSIGEFEEEHIPGSVNIPLDEIKLKLDQFKNQGDIVVFCRSGIRSAEAKHILESNGFNRVCNGGSYKNLKIVF